MADPNGWDGRSPKVFSYYMQCSHTFNMFHIFANCLQQGSFLHHPLSWVGHYLGHPTIVTTHLGRPIVA
eukprot:7451965-Prorocentrum_lima.AAC.1